MAAKSKSELRKGLRAARAALGAEDHALRSSSAAQRLVAELPATVRTILVFVSLGSEIETRPLLHRLWERGRIVCVPRVTGDGAMDAVVVSSFEELRPGFRGILEPFGGDELAPESLDLVVVPGTAFDAGGRRLGQGGGFYDRYLPRTRPDCVRIGLGFDFQVVDRVPSEEHDERVHRVVTDRRVVTCAASD